MGGFQSLFQTSLHFHLVFITDSVSILLNFCIYTLLYYNYVFYVSLFFNVSCMSIFKVYSGVATGEWVDPDPPLLFRPLLRLAQIRWKVFLYRGDPMHVYCNFYCSPAKKYGSDPHFFWAGDATDSVLNIIYLTIEEGHHHHLFWKRPFLPLFYSYKVRRLPNMKSLHISLNIAHSYIHTYILTLPSFQTPFTPEVTSGTSTITCYTKYNRPAQHVV